VFGRQGSLWAGAPNDDAAAITLHGSNVRVGLQHELALEGRDGAGQYLRVAERAQVAAASQHRDTNTQTMQRLSELKTDNARADHGHGFGQVGPVEDIVTDDESLAQCLERIRVVSTRTGRDDDAFGLHAGMVGDCQCPVVDETRVAEKAVRVRNLLHFAERKGVQDARLQELRWLLEELRVSLFAQELRTPQPVSVKRLEKVWGQVG